MPHFPLEMASSGNRHAAGTLKYTLANIISQRRMFLHFLSQVASRTTLTAREKWRPLPKLAVVPCVDLEHSIRPRREVPCASLSTGNSLFHGELACRLSWAWSRQTTAKTPGNSRNRHRHRFLWMRWGGRSSRTKCFSGGSGRGKMAPIGQGPSEPRRPKSPHLPPLWAHKSP